MQPSEKNVARVRSFFHKKHNHVLIGELALELRTNIDVVANIVETLVTSGSVRAMNNEEKAKVGLQSNVEAYVLAEDRLLRLAHE